MTHTPNPFFVVQAARLQDRRRAACTTKGGSTALGGHRLETFAHLAGLGPAHLPNDLTVAQEDVGRPQLDAERPAQRLALAVLDADVAHRRELAEQAVEDRTQGFAVLAPRGAELQHDRPLPVGDRLPRRLADDLAFEAVLRQPVAVLAVGGVVEGRLAQGVLVGAVRLRRRAVDGLTGGPRRDGFGAGPGLFVRTG